MTPSCDKRVKYDARIFYFSSRNVYCRVCGSLINHGLVCRDCYFCFGCFDKKFK
jgi:hypothetical protein